MKKIIIVDGGPRRNMNTAAMLDSFARGVANADSSIEVKRVRLYELDYKGCMSCLACKVKGHASNVCVFKDGLHDLLEVEALEGGIGGEVDPFLLAPGLLLQPDVAGGEEVAVAVAPEYELGYGVCYGAFTGVDRVLVGEQGLYPGGGRARHPALGG